jgi:hypothetical protein
MEVVMSKLAVLGSALSLAAGCVVSGEDNIIEQSATVSTSPAYTGTRIARVRRAGLAIEDGRLLPPGGDAAGLLLAATLDDGRRLRLRVDEVEPFVGAGDLDLVGYRVSYSFDGQVWGTLCGTPDNLAVVLEGTWYTRTGVTGAGGPIEDPEHFTFACREAPLATCVELGYAPWRVIDPVSLRDHHTACVRMLRGDFCGDGTAWRDTPITLDVSDALRIHTAEHAWPHDATWSARGATCAAPRTFAAGTPACLAALAACSPALDDTALLVSTTYPSRPPVSSTLRGASRTTATP